jgi:hypothetical protein
LKVSFGRLGPAPAVDGGFKSTFVFGVSAVSDRTLILGPAVDTCVASCRILLDSSSTCSAAFAAVVATSLDFPDHQEERY